MRRPITAHLSSESGPHAARFALDFAPHADGDVVWLAYVPDGLRSWFRRFADDCDPSPTVAGVFRVARLFDSPRPDEIALIADRIRDGGRADRGVFPMAGERVSAAVAELAAEIDRGGLHVTTIILDIHHLPDFVRRLRAQRTPTSHASIYRVLRALIAKLRDANLHVLVTTTREVGAAAGTRAVGRRDAPGVVDALDDLLDLTIAVGPTRPARESPHRFPVRIERSRDPLLPVTHEMAPTCWDDLFAPIGPDLAWADRLRSSCPRLDDRRLVEATDGAWAGTDPTQEGFAGQATGRGWEVEVASPEQDRREHWDLRIRRGDEDYRVDVKGQSRVRRGDAEPQDAWHWVELRGIADDGWLFGGRADLIAFRTRTSFVLVGRDDLLAHVRHHVDPDDVVDDPRAAIYRVYHRKDGGGRESARPTGADRGVLTLLPIRRLRALARDEWDLGPRAAPTGGPGDRSWRARPADRLALPLVRR